MWRPIEACQLRISRVIASVELELNNKRNIPLIIPPTCTQNSSDTYTMLKKSKSKVLLRTVERIQSPQRRHPSHHHRRQPRWHPHLQRIQNWIQINENASVRHLSGTMVQKSIPARDPSPGNVVIVVMFCAESRRQLQINDIIWGWSIKSQTQTTPLMINKRD